MGIEIIHREAFTRIVEDAAHDGESAGRIIIRNTIIHTRVLFRAEDAAHITVTTLKHIHFIRITGVEHEIGPRHTMQATGCSQISIPTLILLLLDVGFHPSRCPGIEDNCFVTKISKAVSAGLMLDDTTGILRIRAITRRTDTDRRSIPFIVGGYSSYVAYTFVYG